jgi:shikimate kinase
MGSGKSTAGKKLASLLNWSFIDTDKKIEEHTGKSITEIFEQEGEDNFRIIESKILRDLKPDTDTVVATGGGTPCYQSNMDFMNETGLTIYLKLSPGQLLKRLTESKGERPLIKNMNRNELLQFIEEKLGSRENWYGRSEVIINGIDLDIKNLRDLVKKRLQI